MTKQEFLESLERHLRGQIPEAQILENMDYYRSYIEKEEAAGKTEEEVMQILGDPWLIAKTLIESANRTPGENRMVYESEAEREDGGDSRTGSYRSWKLDLTTWYGKLIVIAGAALGIFLLFTLMSILLPIVLCLMAVGFVIRLFRNR